MARAVGSVHVRCSVSEAFSNQRLLETEAKNLQAQSAKYAKQTSQWLVMIDSFNNALKVRAARWTRTGARRLCPDVGLWRAGRWHDPVRARSQELGDVQSWAQSIENDMRTIASALEYVHQGSGAAAAGADDEEGGNY